MVFYQSSRSLLTELGLPDSDRDEVPDTPRTFPDGSQWRIEVPTVNTADAAEALLVGAAKRGIRINRMTETAGMMRHTEAEIRRYLALGREHDVQVLMSVCPRAVTDLSATARTAEGARIGYRLRGGEQLVRALEDIRHGISLGVRGLVVYDEGLLWALGELRRREHLPADMHFKVSAHCGHGNAASLRLLEQLGADSINPVRDLSVGMLGTLRRSIAVPLDVHVDNPPSSGGFIRTLEVPDIVVRTSPVFLKTGNSALAGHGVRPTATEIAAMLDQIEIVVETMHRHYPTARQSNMPAPLVSAV